MFLQVNKFRVSSFAMTWIRIDSDQDLWCIKGTSGFTLVLESSVSLMNVYRHPSDHGSQILI